MHLKREGKVQSAECRMQNAELMEYFLASSEIGNTIVLFCFDKLSLCDKR